MTNDPALLVWTRYLDGEVLPDGEQQALIQAIVATESSQQEFTSDQVVDRLLRFAATKESDDAFVRECVARFKSLDLRPDNDPEQDFQIVIDRKIGSEDGIQQLGQRKRRVVWKLAAMVTAATILIACLIVVIGRDGLLDLADWQRGSESGAPPPIENHGTTPSAVTEPETLPAIDDLELPSLADSNRDHPATPVPDPGKSGVATGEELTQPNETSDVAEVADEVDERREIVVNGPAWGSLELAADARWLIPPAGDHLPTGPLKLLSGSATLNLNNQIQIKIVAPADIEIRSGDLVELASGRIELASPAKASRFSLVTADATLSDLERARVFVVTNASGTEVVLGEGNLLLAGTAREDRRPETQPIRLEEDRLAHAFVSAGGDVEYQPGVMVAHGHGKYLGQVLSDGGSHQVSSPSELEDYLETIRPPTVDMADLADPSVGETLRDQIFQFNRMFRQIQQLQSVPRQNRVESFDRRYSFQGEITIDGRKVQFSNPEEFREFQRRLNNRRWP